MVGKMIGRVVSHYRILERIGSGGMGVVYKAEDTRLQRLVAVKVLSEELARDGTAIERFRREARAASALNHPNICTIHEIDEIDGAPFFVMELLDGQTVRDALRHGPLPHERVVDLAIEFAEALATAHQAGIIHRDLKPANLFITRLGHLKILDFGLAKLLTSQPAEYLTSAPTDPRGLTAGDTTLGTVGYMSPEQARGEELDTRSDLFSLGAVLYEMATGRRPFDAPTVPLVFDAILHRAPPPSLDVSRELLAIILKALEKDRELRYQSAAEIRADLKRLRRESGSSEVAAAATKRRPRGALFAAGAFVVIAVAGLVIVQRRTGPSTPARQTSVAVLPFSNLGGDREHDYLRYALPDELITLLSYSPALAVRPFATTRAFTDADPQAAGRTLKVSDIVTGHFRISGAQLAVTLEAIDVERNELVWRDTVEGPRDDLVALRERIASRIRSGLLPKIRTGAGEDPASRPESDEAYALYLRAVAEPSDPEPNRKALAMLLEATRIDPGYAPAWARLSQRYYNEYNYGGGGKDAFAAAEAAGRRALEIDPNLPAASRMLVTLSTERGDLETAYRAARDLVRRRPESADAQFSLGYVLRYAGMVHEAARQCEIANALDPTSSTHRSCALVHLCTGDMQRARAFARLDEASNWSTMVTMFILLREGRLSEAVELGRKRNVSSPYWPVFQACHDKPDPAEFRPLVATMEAEMLQLADPEGIYFAAVLLGHCADRGPALRMLRAAVERNYCSWPAIDSDPAFARFRDDPELAGIRRLAQECQNRFLTFRKRGEV